MHSSKGSCDIILLLHLDSSNTVISISYRYWVLSYRLRDLFLHLVFVGIFLLRTLSLSVECLFLLSGAVLAMAILWCSLFTVSLTCAIYPFFLVLLRKKPDSISCNFIVYIGIHWILIVVWSFWTIITFWLVFACYLVSIVWKS